MDENDDKVNSCDEKDVDEDENVGVDVKSVRDNRIKVSITTLALMIVFGLILYHLIVYQHDQE